MSSSADQTSVFTLSPPLPQHLNIVALETCYTPLPPIEVPAPHTFTLTTYESTTAEEAGARIADADIVIITVTPLRADALSAKQSPRLRLIAVMASGTDVIDLAACTARGIRVLNSAHCNTISLAEHVTSLYLATRRSLLPVMRAMTAGQWTQKGSLMSSVYTCGVPPRSCADETLAIIGYGGVGQNVARMLGGLGMQVLVSDRREDRAPPGPGPVPASGTESGSASGTDSETSTPSTGPARIPFTEALRRATVLVVCCPRLPSTLGLIGAEELALMRPDAILINVSRGNIVGEQALVDALRAGRLAGAGVDVFDHEPADTENSPLIAAAAVGDLNLVLSAHTAWVSASTLANYQRAMKENVENFIKGIVNPARIRA